MASDMKPTGTMLNGLPIYKDGKPLQVGDIKAGKTYHVIIDFNKKTATLDTRNRKARRKKCKS